MKIRYGFPARLKQRGDGLNPQKTNLLMACLLSAILLHSCATPGPSPSYGIQHGLEAYVPARIAVLGCQQLSAPGSHHKGLITIDIGNIGREEIEGLCSQFDKEIIQGFGNQPYMKGFTPAYVHNLLKKANATPLLNELQSHWDTANKVCHGCRTGLQTYTATLSHQESWLNWLNRFSTCTRYSDALLLPLLTEARQQVRDNRGIWISERSAKIELFLIDTNNGKLLWAGNGSASVNNQSLRESPTTPAPPFPHWDRLKERLFTESLWRRFPGRLIR